MATHPGASWNIPPLSPLVLRTTFPGVSVSNPPYAGGTWITSQGAEEEGEDRLALRSVSRWGTLGVGGNSDAFKFWALCIPNGYTASPVSQVVTFANFYNGTFASGACTVVIIGPAGALGPGDVAAVQQNFEAPITSLANGLVINGQTVVIPGLDQLAQKYPINCRVYVVSATNLAVVLTGTISIYRKSNASIADVQAAVTNALTAYQQTIQIGEVLYPQDKIAGVIGQAAPFQSAIAKVDLSGMPAQITPTLTQYPLLDASGLTYQLVDI